MRRVWVWCLVVHKPLDRRRTLCRGGYRGRVRRPTSLPEPASLPASLPASVPGSRSARRLGDRPGDRRRPFVRSSALVAVVALVVAGCTATTEEKAPPTPQQVTPDASSAPDDGLEPFYGQELAWQSCEDDLQCATVEVPLDYAAPGGDRIKIRLNRHPATGTERIGSLLLNPGGPGGSGFDFLPDALDTVSKDVQEHYDLVGFDPRGVQNSDPKITCYSAPEMDALLAADADTSSPAGVQEAIDRFADFSKACLDNTGPVLGHVDTVSAARDMDVLRAVLGDTQLHYLGYSYGTQLGATYASLFPQRVGRVVLDGAVDPTLSSEESTFQQAVGFENALRAYVADCQAGRGCPLKGDLEDGLSQVKRLLDRAKVSPLPTGDDERPLTQSLAFTGIAVTLYSQTFWTYLTSALTAAIRDGDGSILLTLSDAYYDRQSNGTYGNNSTEAFWSIGCVDSRSSADLDAMAAEAERIQEAAPTVGELFSYGAVLCAQWSVPLVGGLEDYSAEGAAPIVVIGTTNDPATPYAQAEALATILDSGVLLTYEGEGHTAYGRSNDCITDAVDAYLIDGTVPTDGTRC